MVDKKHSVLAGVDFDPNNDMELNPKKMVMLMLNIRMER